MGKPLFIATIAAAQLLLSAQVFAQDSARKGTELKEQRRKNLLALFDHYQCSLGKLKLNKEAVDKYFSTVGLVIPGEPVQGFPLPNSYLLRLDCHTTRDSDDRLGVGVVPCNFEDDKEYVTASLEVLEPGVIYGMNVLAGAQLHTTYKGFEKINFGVGRDTPSTSDLYRTGIECGPTKHPFYPESLRTKD